jgi:hypothetical protein
MIQLGEVVMIPGMAPAGYVGLGHCLSERTRPQDRATARLLHRSDPPQGSGCPKKFSSKWTSLMGQDQGLSTVPVRTS